MKRADIMCEQVKSHIIETIENEKDNFNELGAN